MNKEDIDFVEKTEKYRSVSKSCIWLTILVLVIHEVTFLNILVNWKPSIAFVIGLALLSVAFRTIAIDRFLRMAHQVNCNERNPDI